MTTTEQATGPAYMEASLVQLILLRSHERLPIPQCWTTSDDSISLEFTSPTALELWATELEKRGASGSPTRRSEDTSYDFRIMRGWPCKLHLRAKYERPDPPEPLDAATLDALAEVAQ